MIRRPPRSTQSRSSAASDVYKRQDLLEHLIGGGGGQGLPGVKYPDAVLLRERPGPTDRAQGDLLPGAVHFQGIAGLQMEFFPQRFGDNDAACFIDNKAGVHSGTILWVDPSVNTILLQTELCLCPTARRPDTMDTRNHATSRPSPYLRGRSA